MNLLSRVIRGLRKRALLRKGYSSYAVSQWGDLLKNEYRSSDLPKKERKWAYERGFLPYRIAQYGLTEENYKTIISDEDYNYLFPLNKKYGMWVADKLTTRYTLAPFNRFLPEYYYHLMKDRDVMRLMDCPQEYPVDLDGIIALLREKKLLAAKKASGSRGVGFYKLETDGEGFIANGNTKTEAEFRAFLETLDDYIITEYVEMHPMLKKINPYSVNTIRATVINPHGNDAIFPFAFFRIGTKQSGIVDNVAQGGMVCKIDVKTGRFYDGQTLRNHVYQNVEYHPDTHERLEGILPNWQLVRHTLLEIMQYCPQLSWLGFDVAITEDSFKILEINVHQQLHKAHEYPPEVMDFLFSQLKNKKKRYHLM